MSPIHIIGHGTKGIKSEFLPDDTLLSKNKVAKIFEVSPSTIHSAYHRARIKTKEIPADHPNKLPAQAVTAATFPSIAEALQSITLRGEPCHPALQEVKKGESFRLDLENQTVHWYET